MQRYIIIWARQIVAVLVLAITSLPVAVALEDKTPQVQLVVVARMIKPGEGSKHKWIRIEINQVIKATHFDVRGLPKIIDAFQMYDESEVPETWCEVYLVPFESDIHPNTWRVSKWLELKADKPNQ